ncbi:MAG: DUF1295 domain-containing protein [Bacteroidetes bacterium]|nr:DUF1295 domain-containing protein [Bacteroidota bacterium]
MNAWLSSLLIVLAYVHLAYLFSRFTKRNDFMDILWGPGFALIAAFNYFVNFEAQNLDKLIFLILILAWAARLAIHIYLKNGNKEEDFRYAKWRKEWGNTEWWRSYLQIYLLQGLFMYLISLGIIAFLSSSTSEWNNFHFCLALPAVIGLIIESIADYQKFVFKKKYPKGLMKSGLWAYSRHPNYFGEAVFWWGIALLSSLAAPFYYGLFSAICITWLLRYVSGVPMLEKAKEGNLEYEAYKKSTPIFIPFLKA